MKAKTLADAISVFNPREALDEKTLPEFYVNRPGNPLVRMKIYLLGAREQPVKLLFSGHRGSGKTTELNKLAEELRHQFILISVPLAKFVNLNTLTYQDVLLYMALALFKCAVTTEAVARSPVQVVQEGLNEAARFVGEKLYGPAFLSPPALEGDLSLKLNAWIGEIELKYGLAQNARDKLTTWVDGHLDELHVQIDRVAQLLSDAGNGRLPMFIVEGTDKTDISRALSIFRDHTLALTGFRSAAAIYTFPISLAHSGDFNQFRNAFDERFRLPNLTLMHRDGTPDTKGQEGLREIILRRLSENLIEKEALDLLAQASGGLVVTLIRLTRAAAVYTLSHSELPQIITVADVRAAISDERNDYIRQLQTEDYPVLAARRNDKTLSGDLAVQELLHNVALLEYANDQPWCDVNPVLWDLVTERTS